MKTDGFSVGAVIQGPVPVPGSKSIAQRALVAAAFAHGTTEVVGLPPSDDVLRALGVARAVGARFPSAGRADDPFVDALLRRRGQGRLTGAPPLVSDAARSWCTAEVGESGTLARLSTALLGLARPAGSGASIVPAGSLARRRSPALFAALRAAGAGVEHVPGAEHGWPVMLTAPPRVRTVRLVSPTSSQEVSALLMALAAHEGVSRLEVFGGIPSEPYVGLTLDLLDRFGVGLERLPPDRAYDSDPERVPSHAYVVGGPLRAPEEPLVIEPDASSAAVALAAGCLTGGEVFVEGLGAASLQPDLACIEVLRAFGCHAAAEPGRWIAAGRPDRGVELDLEHAPDLAPVAAALAADVALRGLQRSRLTGLGTLPGKESQRIAVLARGLAALGVATEHGPDWLALAPAPAVRRAAQPILLDPAGDHRMAFAFALMSLVVPDVRVERPDCVAKSWPTFWSDLAACGAQRAAR
ncbi:MAG: hypothetical protein R3F49_19935 [Planctomycetota bacterium]